MTAYVIAEVSPKKSLPEHKKLIQKYSLAAAKTIRQFGGEMLAKSLSETLDGPEDKTMKVIITFPTSAQARTWYNSKEYQSLIALRDSAMICRFQLVEGQ